MQNVVFCLNLCGHDGSTTVLAVSIKWRQQIYICMPWNWTWNENTNILHANSICSYFFPSHRRIFLHLITFELLMLNPLNQLNTQLTKNTIRLYLKQYRLVEIFETIKMEITACKTIWRLSNHQVFPFIFQ